MKKVDKLELYNLFIRVHNKYTRIRKDFSEMSDSVQVYPAELQVLSLLSAGNEETVSSIAAQLSITRSAASQLVKKLCGKGLLEKNRPVENERVVSLRITDEGMNVVNNFFGSQSGFGKELEKTLSGFSPRDLVVVAAFFTKLEEQLNRKLDRKGADE